MENIMLEYVKARIKERTSWDGGVIIAGSLAIILFGGIVKMAAWVGLAYGIWTLVKKEED
jgi:hypothetical protein|tara:strand:+ start:322 stop:501 length:180 start_codon:yes stop_codon:yes gene_type:complete